MSSSSLEEVRTTTGTSLVRGSARIRCSTSIPSSLGSLRSSSTTAGIVGGSRPACRPVPKRKSTASWPSLATTTLLAMFAFRSARSVSSSSFGLSSTSKIVFSIIVSRRWRLRLQLNFAADGSSEPTARNGAIGSERIACGFDEPRTRLRSFEVDALPRDLEPALLERAQRELDVDFEVLDEQHLDRHPIHGPLPRPAWQRQPPPQRTPA